MTRQSSETLASKCPQRFFMHKGLVPPAGETENELPPPVKPSLTQTDV